MDDVEGSTIWSAQHNCYGQIENLVGKAKDCPFRYPEQYEDVETGLYYNRFRYYSPEEGMYISQDPIGIITGTINLYSYVTNLNIYVDVLGLDCANTILDNVGLLAGKKKSDIQTILRNQGFSKTTAGNGGDIWTKAGSDQKTVAIRLDPASGNIGFADDQLHAHKEIIPTNKVVNGNYPNGKAKTYNDLGIQTSKTDWDSNHISIIYEKFKRGIFKIKSFSRIQF